MPGLAGVIGTEDARGVLEGIVARLRHRPGCRVSIRWRPGLALARIERPAPGRPGETVDAAPLPGVGICLVHGRPGTAPQGTAAPDWITKAIADGREAELASLGGSFHAVHAAGDRVSLVSDRFGHQPLHLARFQGGVAFAPEAQALAGLPGVDDIPDVLAIRQLLEHGHPFDQRTLLRGIELLPPGTVADIGPGGWRSRRYFRFDPPSVDPALSAEDLGAAMGRAVAAALEQAGGGTALGCMLSGGMDSRTIAAEAVALGARPLAITFGTPGSPDVAIAERVASALGLEHLVLSLDPARVAEALPEAALVTGGTTGVAHLVGHATNRELARDVDAILSGMCGDGIMGNVPADAPRRPVRAARGLPDSVGRHLMSPVFRRETDEPYRESLEADAAGYPPGTGLDVINTFEAMRNRWRRLTLSGVVSRHIDTEVLLPFFHQPLLETAFALAPERRRHQAAYLESFCARHPACATIPWERTGRPPTAGGAPPPPARRAARALLRRIAGSIGIAAGKKAGHFEFAAELRGSGPLRTMAVDLLTDETAARRPWLDAAGVRRLLDEHAAGRADHLHPLTRALTIELFLRGVNEPHQ